MGGSCDSPKRSLAPCLFPPITAVGLSRTGGSFMPDLLDSLVTSKGVQLGIFIPYHHHHDSGHPTGWTFQEAQSEEASAIEWVEANSQWFFGMSSIILGNHTEFMR